MIALIYKLYKKIGSGSLLILLLGWLTFGFTSTSQASTFTVTSFSDSGLGTFRQAIIDANTNGVGLDSIYFSTSGAVTLSSALPSITSSISIFGKGADITTIQAASTPNTATYRVLSINSPSATVKLYDVSIKNGNIAGNGGGILVSNATALYLYDCNIEGNKSTGNTGGGVDIGLGNFYAYRTAFINNVHNTNGGAVGCHQGTSSINYFENCTFSGNSGNSNQANHGGGAFYMYSFGGTHALDFINCTFSGNTLGGNQTGNGISVFVAPFTGSTINLNFLNTILNDATYGSYFNYSGGGTLNLTRNYTLCKGTSIPTTGTGNLNNASNLLGTLDYHGGPTLVYSLSATSAAKDAGTSTGAPSVDQRNVPTSGTKDIGSFEVFEQACAVPVLSSSTTKYGASRKYDITNIQVASQGPVGTVSAGASVTVTFSYAISQGGTSCPGCINQFYWGIYNVAGKCERNYGGYCNCSGTASMTFTAPSTPGVYNIGYGHQLGYSCGANPKLRVSSARSSAIGVLIVGSPTNGSYATVSGNSTYCPSVSDSIYGSYVTGYSCSGYALNKYQWYLDGAPITGGVNANQEMMGSGAYKVLWFNSQGDSIFSDSVVVSPYLPVIVANKNPTFYLNSSGTISIPTDSLYTSASVECGIITSVVVSDTSFACGDATDSLYFKSGALDFDGTDDFIDIPHNSALNPFPMTAEVWVKTTSNSAGEILNKYAASSGNGWRIGAKSDGKLEVFKYGGGTHNFIGNGSINDGKWHHVSLVIDPTSAKLYIDGVLDKTNVVASSGSPTTTVPLRIGRYNTITNQNFNGEIDEVRIWNVAKTQSEILDFKNNELNGGESGLVAYYDFEAGTGSKLIDRTGNGHTGTLSNMDTTTSWINRNDTIIGVLVTITATDDASNQIKDTVYVNLLDTLAPNPSIQGAVVYLNTSGVGAFSSAGIVLDSGEVCDDVLVSFADTTITCADYSVVNNCTVSTGYTASVNGATSGSKRGQSFTSVHYGAIEKIKFQVWPTGTPHVVIRKWVSDVYANAFDGAILGTSNTATDMPANTSWPTWGEMSTFTFDTPVVIDSNTKYVLQVMNGQPYVVHNSTYSGGQAYETLNPNSTKDFRFEVYSCPVSTNSVTLEDASGNTITKRFAFAVLDTISPSLTIIDTTLYVDANGNADTISVYDLIVNISDNCGIESLTYSQDTLTIQHLGANTIGVTVTDSSGNSFTDSVIVFVKEGGAPYAGLGNKLYFDGSNDRIDIAHDASLNLNSFTAEAWFRTTQTPGSYKRILIKRSSSGGQNYSLAVHNGKPHVRMDASGGKQAEGSDNVNDGLWHHMAGVHNTSTNELILYVDGKEVAKTTGVPSPSAGSFPLSIGGASGFSQNFEGDIDEIRVWNVAKSAQDIKDNYRIRANSSDPSLVAYYNFDSEDGLALMDVSSNPNHGTLVNMASNLWADSHDSLVWAYNENEVINDTVAWATAWDKIEGDTLTFFPISGFDTLFTLDSISGAIKFNGVFDYEAKSIYPLAYGVYDLSGNLDTAVSVISIIDDTTETVYAGLGEALQFNGTNHYVTIPTTNLPTGNSPRTVVAWVNVGNSGVNKSIINWGASTQTNNTRFCLYYDVDGSIRVVGENNDRPGKTVINDGKWHHIAATHDGSTVSLYIDGQLDTSHSVTYNTANTVAYIGKRTWANDEYFGGSIDEVKIWSVALDSNQIADSYRRRVKGSETGLVRYYNFDAIDDKLRDLTSNEADGSLVNLSTSDIVASGDSLRYRLSENTPTGDTAAYAIGWDSDDSELEFRFVSGNTRNSFNIDSLTGVITVKDDDELKYYVDSSYVLEYEVIEKGDGRRDTAFIDIRLDNENAPPYISAIGNDTICSGGIGDSLLFMVGDLDLDDSTQMTLSAFSSDTVLIPNANITFYNTASADSARTLRVFLPDSSVNAVVPIMVIVTDRGDLMDTAYFNVQIDSLPSIDLGIDTAFCYNTTYTINAGANKGAYSWNTSANGASITLDSSDRATYGDTYYVGITDLKGCFNSDTVFVDTLQVPVIADSVFNVYCKGDASAVITLDGLGGSPGYNFTWDASVSSTSGTGNKVAESLTAGSYKVTITDINNCQDSSSYVVTEPSLDVALTLIAYENVFCKTDSTGWISVKSIGGTAPRTYSWNDYNNQTDTLAVNLPTGSYQVIVTDSNGCTDSATQFIGEPAIQLAASVNDYREIYCKNDSTGYIESGVIGGTGAVTYQWNDFRNQTTVTADSLPVGTYNLMITDSLGCQDSLALTLGEPAIKLAISLDSVLEVYCKNDATGFINTNTIGGTGSYTYLWNDPQLQTASNSINLSTGTYQVVVTDSLGCQDSLTQFIDEPSAIVSVALDTSLDVYCKFDSTGSVSVTSMGGVGEHAYLWNDYANQSDSIALNLPVGTYQVIVTDTNGCSDSLTHTLIEPSNALSFVFDADSIRPLCSTDTIGKLSVSATGATGSYNYLWNDSRSQTTRIASTLLPNSYRVTITDSLGCSDSSQAYLTPWDTLVATLILPQDTFCSREIGDTLIGGPANDGVFTGLGVANDRFNPTGLATGEHVVTYTRTDRSCVAVAMDTLWINPNPNASIANIGSICDNTPPLVLNQGFPNGGRFFGNEITSDSIYTPVSSGFDTLYYEFENTFGCFDTTQRIITVNAKPTVSFASIPRVCADTLPFLLTQGAPNTGGTGYYEHIAVANNIFYPALSGTGTIDSIKYVFTDSKFCSDSIYQSVIIDTLPVLITSQTQEICVNADSIDLSTSNYVIPIGGTYSGTGVSNNYFKPDVAGVATNPVNYSFTDANGCEADTQITIVVRPKPVVTYVGIDSLCLDADTASLLRGQPMGGFYSGMGVVDSNFYLASKSGTGLDTLTYVYSNSFGCFDSTLGYVRVNALPDVYFATALGSYCSSTDTVNINKGFPVYNGIGTGVYTGFGVVKDTLFSTSLADTGDHIINYTYTDINGCESSADTTLRVDSVPMVSLASINPICENIDTLVLTGGLPQTFGANDSSYYSGVNVINQSALVHQAVGIDTVHYHFIDANGCTDSATQIVVVNALPVVDLTLPVDSLCANDSTLKLSDYVNINGGVFAGNGVSNGLFEPEQSGSGVFVLSYTYTNSNSCINTDIDTIKVNAVPQIDSAGVIPQFCSTDNVELLSVWSGLPAGGLGWYSGVGVTSDSTSFDAVAAGTGNHAVSYKYGVNGCFSYTAFTVKVNALPQVTIASIPSFCNNVDTFRLTGGNPVGSGGYYTGTGVAGTRYDVSLVTDTTDTLTYVFTDANGCTDSASTVFDLYVAPSVSLNPLADRCENHGTETLVGLPTTYKGGVGVYSGRGVTGTIFDPISAGSGAHKLSYSITDSRGCKDTAFQYATVNPQPIASLTSFGTICENTAPFTLNQATVSSVTPKAYSYYLLNGSIAGNDSATFDTSLISAPSAQLSYVYVDNKGCSDSVSNTIVVDTVPVVTIASLPSFCNTQGAYKVKQGSPVANGTGNYYGTGVIGGLFYPALTDLGTTNSWTDTLWYQFTDNNGCSDRAFTQVRTKATPVIAMSSSPSVCANEDSLILKLENISRSTSGFGIYSGVGVENDTILKIDSIGLGLNALQFTFIDTSFGYQCADSTSFQINVNSSPSLFVQSVSAICSNASKVLAFGLPSGGIYLDTNGNRILKNRFKGNDFGVGFHKLVYQFMDVNGCSDTISQNIEVLPSPVVQLSLPKNIICKSENIVTLAGGLPIGGRYSGFGILNGQLYTASSGVGNHDIIYSYTDTKGCSANDTAMVTVKDNPALIVSDDTTICLGESAKIWAANAGNRSSYSWNNGLFGDTIVVSPGSSVNYRVLATDSIGCQTNKTVRVNINPIMTLTATGQNSDCKQSNGAASIISQGGLAPYKFIWSNGSNQSVISNLSSGKYFVTVEDANNCVQSTDVVVTDKTGAQIILNRITQPTCDGSNDGAIDISIIGTNVSVKWSNGETTEDINNLSAGDYTLIVEDGAGCSVIKDFTLAAPDKIVAVPVVKISGCSANNGWATFSLSGGTGAYSTKWNSGFVGDTLFNLSAGVYSAEISDANGCVDSAFAVITDSSGPVVELIRILPSDCGSANGEIEVKVTSDSLSSIIWNNGSTGTSLTNLPPGRYSIEATDTSGCSTVESLEVPSIQLGLPELCMVTIDTSSGLVQAIQYLDQAIYKKVSLRKIVSGSPLHAIVSLAPASNNLMNDSSSNFYASSKSYVIEAEDNCGGNAQVSLIHKTIYLTGKITSDDLIELEWSAYSGSQVKEYEILRVTEKGTTVLANISGSTNSFVVTGETFESNSLKFVVRAKLANECSNVGSFYEHSYSNYSPDFGSYSIGVENNPIFTAQRVYPNPTQGEFVIELEMLSENNIEVQLFDLRGKLVFDTQVEGAFGFQEIPVNVSHLSVGMYQLRVGSGAESHRFKIQIAQ